MSIRRIGRLSLDRLLISTFTALLALGVMETVRADPYQLPLLGTSPVAPNVVFTLDDSGSMLSPLMPDNLSSDKADGNCCNVQTMAPEEVVSQYTYSGNEKAYGLIPTRMPNRPSAEYLDDAKRRSSQTNTIYYNPEERYEPWTNSDGTLKAYPTAASTSTWTSVPVDPASTLRANLTPRALGSTTNASSNTTKWCLGIGLCNSLTSYNGGTPELNAATDYDPTVYYVLDNVASPTNTGTVRVSIWNMKEYRRNSFGNTVSTDVSAFARGVKRTDCSLSGGARSCSRAQELQNFATWYMYHRTRLMLAKASVSKAFSSPDITGFRMGWGALNNLDESSQSISVDGGTSTKTLRQGVRNYTSAHRDAFYTWLFEKDANSGTPLRRAVDDIGKYFTREDNKGPWADEPGTSNSQTVASYASCRRAFHILTTDGYWGSGSADAAGTAGATADVEAATGPEITGPNNQKYQYKPGDTVNTGYKDAAANMLADVAMYYWNRDLAPNMTNNVSPTKNNEAFWQHMVNYTVGLGVSGGRLVNPTDLTALKAGTKKWQPSGTTATSADDASKADDLWHAAYNSRGQNLNAANSSEFANSLQAILTDIASESNKTAGVGLAGAILGTGSAKYVPEYTARDWTGDLQKFALDSKTGSSADTATWSAAKALPAYNLRNIYLGTDNGTKLFQLNSFSSTMLSEMGSSPAINDNLINYLRGDDANEGTTTGTYRVRTSRLGDIVNSTPLYVKGTLDYQYNLLSGTPAAGSYRSFLTEMAKREALVYVGANDGMLHVLSDTNGAEVFAYVPRGAVANLSKLADQNYGHRFYVDGAPNEIHAYWGSSWKSVVIGALGAGGKGLYAINATEPTALKSKTTGGNQVLWELTGANANVGYIFGDVDTGPIKDGSTVKWVALVGNGVSSSSNKAQLLVVDISTGAVLATLDTGRGSATAPNGMGGVRAVRNAEGFIVAAYGGDVKGNVWRFDLSATTPTSWRTAFGGQPLFTATDAGGSPQPFTASPNVIVHPRGGNLVVISSGKLIDEADRPGVSAAGSQQQTIYGLWDTTAASIPSTDSAVTIASKTSLLQQTINTTAAATDDGRSYYSISSSVPNWKTHRGWYLNMTLGTGQRVIYPGQLYQGKVLIGSVIPTTSTSCSTATSFNFLLDALTGNANNQVLLDTNGDGVLDSTDGITAIYSTANDGRDRILVRGRQTVASDDGTGTGNTGNTNGNCTAQTCPCLRGVQIVSATNQQSQCMNGGSLAGSRTWRILNNPPRPGAQ